MRFMCACGEKELNIPDDKVPAAPRFVLKCPYCQKKMLIERDGDSAKASFMEEPQAPAPVSKPVEPDLPHVEPEVFPPGAKVAFIDVTDGTWRASAEAYFKANGFMVSLASDPMEALAKMRLNRYDLLFLQDSEDRALLLSEIHSWPGVRRREANVVLLGGEGKSLHPDVAFLKGANFYVNQDDSAKADEVLAGAVEGFDLYYQPFTIAQKRIMSGGE